MKPMRTIGVLGGIGPQATWDLEARIHAVAQELVPPQLLAEAAVRAAIR